MAERFVLQNTYIVCNKAIGILPKKLICDENRTKIATFNTCKKEPFMTISDKKLNACFNCKAPAKKWGMIIGTIVGLAVAAAIIITAPISAPALLVTAAIVGGTMTGIYVGVGAAAVAAIAHSCDPTLEGFWQLEHKRVKIDHHENALLLKSVLVCPIGGTLHLTENFATARRAMLYLTVSNSTEVILGIGTSSFIGSINGALTALAGPLDLTIMAGCTLLFNTLPAIFESERKNEDYSLEEGAKKEGYSWARDEATNWIIEKVFKHVITDDTLLNGLILLEKYAPNLAYNFLDDVIELSSPSIFFGESGFKGRVTSGFAGILSAIFTAGISLGSDYLQSEIEQKTEDMLNDFIADANQDSTFNVITTTE